MYILSSIIMATSKITVELLKDMAHLGRKGQIIEVSTPQARNSLIPQGIAKEITAERMKKIEADKKRASDQARIRLTQANEKFSIQFEKQDIKLPIKTHIKTAGEHLVYLHITRDTLAKIIVEVTVE